MFVLLVSPILFGAVHTYAYTLRSLGILTASLLVLIENFGKDPNTGSDQIKIPKTYLDFMFVVLLIFKIIQVILFNRHPYIPGFFLYPYKCLEDIPLPFLDKLADGMQVS